VLEHTLTVNTWKTIFSNNFRRSLYKRSQAGIRASATR